ARLGVGLALAVFVIVGDDHGISATEKVVVVVVPLADAAGMGGGNVAKLDRSLGVVLALAVENKLPGLHPRDQLGQPVEHPAHALKVPNPSALTVRAAIAKAVFANLSVIAHDLKQQHVLLVTIGIDRADLPLAAALVRWRLGIEPALVGALPNHIEVGPARRPVRRPAHRQGGKLERRAAALGAVIKPDVFVNAVGADGIAVGTVPAELAPAAVTGLAPQLDAGGLAELIEVGAVAHRTPPINRARDRGGPSPSSGGPRSR